MHSEENKLVMELVTEKMMMKMPRIMMKKIIVMLVMLMRRRRWYCWEFACHGLSQYIHT